MSKQIINHVTAPMSEQFLKSRFDRSSLAKSAWRSLQKRVSISQNQGEGISQKRAPIIWNQGRFDLTSHHWVEKDYCKIRCNPNFSANLDKSDLHKDWEFQWENDQKIKWPKITFPGSKMVPKVSK